jgi:hypothetical protein
MLRRGDLAGSRALIGCTRPAYQYPVKSPPAGFSGQRRLRPGGLGCTALWRGQNGARGSWFGARRVETHKKAGDPVAAGDTIFTVYVENEAPTAGAAIHFVAEPTFPGRCSIQPSPGVDSHRALALIARGE